MNSQIKNDQAKDRKSETRKSPPKVSEERQKAGENYNEKHDDKKRYDEADPNWRNPDVEMDDQGENNNIGPQS